MFNPLTSYLKAAGNSQPGGSCLVRSIQAIAERDALERRRQELEREISKLRTEIRDRQHEARMNLLFNEQQILALRIQADLDDPVNAEIRRLESSNANLRALIGEQAIDWPSGGSTANKSNRTISKALRTADVAPALAGWSDVDEYDKHLRSAKADAERRLQRRGSRSGRAGRIAEIMCDPYYGFELRTIINGVKDYESSLGKEIDNG